MERYLIAATVLSILSSVLGEPDLQQINSNHDELNPLNEDANLTSKLQEKRTLFNPTIRNYAWAKHVGIRPSGTKYLLGYSPIDLKYRPVLRPISNSHQGYHYDRPKIYFHLKKPVPIHVPPPSHLLTKPARPLVHVDHLHEGRPAGHLHLNPVPHLDHVHAQEAPAVHVDHVHSLPVPHVDHVHSLPVPHVDHVHKQPHLVHLHQVPVPVAQAEHVHQVPLQPAVPLIHVQAAQVPHTPHLIPQAQFLPSAQLFEVTKPDLGVLPFGAVFQSQVLRDVPAPQFKPALVHQHFVPVPHVQPLPSPPVQHVTHLHPVPSAQPITHLQPVAQAPQAIAQVEYHGTTNFINVLRGQAPVDLLPDHYHLQYPQIPQTPHQHAVPEYQIPRPSVFQQQLPHQEPVQVVHAGTTGLFPSQQQLPLDSQSHFQEAGHNVFQQQLPQTQNKVHQHQFQSGNDVQHVFPQGNFQIDQNSVHQHHFQSGNDVQHVFPQDNFQIDQNNVQQSHFPSGNDVQQQGNFQKEQQEGNVQQEGRYPQAGNFQPADQVSSVHFYRPGQFEIGEQNVAHGYFYQRPENLQGHGQSIRPGETDLQLPLHLPHHPGFDGTGRQFKEAESEEDEQRIDGGFRPSIQLEPPYEKK